MDYREEREGSMMFWRCILTVGIVLIWTSVIVISYGTYLQVFSPNYQEYEQHIVTKITSQNPGKDLGFALTLISAWPFTAAFCAAIGLLFIFGVLTLRLIAVWSRDFMLVASGIFTSGCLLGSLLGIGEAIDSLRWGFIALSVGYLLAAGGLIFGAVGVLGCCRCWGCNRLWLSFSSGSVQSFFA